MKTETKTAIESCKNMGEYLTALNNNFLLEDCKPGKLAKDILVNTLSSKFQNVSIKPEVRTQAVNSANMLEFLNVVKNNFDTTVPLSINAKQKLVPNTQLICTLVRLKEKP